MSNISWVPASNGVIPPNAIYSGYDLGGKKLYVARGKYMGGMIPGKIVDGYKVAAVGYNGKEVGVVDYEVLVAPRGAAEWELVVQGTGLPDNAIIGGRDPNGDTYYIGRVAHEGTLTTGKVHKEHGVICIPFGGSEHAYTCFEVLVASDQMASPRNVEKDTSHRQPQGKIPSSEDKDDSEGEVPEAGFNKKLCTFTVSGNKMLSQQWYHCNTCDMVDRNGVCAICARVCHKGHDLIYADHSDFFCDCGEKGAPDCKSLKPRPRNSKVGPVPPAPPKDWRDAGLDRHNVFRKRHGAPPMKLDPAINKMAQKTADYLASHRMMQHISQQMFGHSYGENLAMTSANHTAESAAIDAIDRWYNEVRDYNYGYPGFTMGTGHFTQVVWKKSTRLGLGYARNGNYTIVVGQYDPPGNYTNQFRENVTPS